MKNSILIILFTLIGQVTIAQEGGVPGNANDGIDNDNDGYIDCFDSECAGSPFCDGFAGNLTPPCQYIPPPTSDFQLSLKWTSSGANMDNRQVPLVGDIDNDGVPEVLGKDDDNANEIYIFDGITGALELTITSPESETFQDAMAIGDVDLDGFGEIFFVSAGSENSGTDERRLICYEHDGTEKWRTAAVIGYAENADRYNPALADFNQDGIPEVYCGNEIYNALTGALIAQAGSTENFGDHNSQAGEAFPIAVDILPDAFCPDCSGLELIAGDRIYSVNVGTGTITLAQNFDAPTNAGALRDGFTSIADMDNDGDIDIVVNNRSANNGVSGGFGITDGRSVVYVWDGQTNTLLGGPFQLDNCTAAATPPAGQNSITNTGGHPNLADFNGDGTIEIGLAGKHFYLVIDFDAAATTPQLATTELWSRVTFDASQRTGSTVFDFQGDGANEVVYRDEDSLFVYNGVTGAIMDAIACNAATRTDFPIIADVNNDGQTNLIVSCGSTIVAFEATTQPWVKCRQVWNQHSYYIVNVNDDLTIPAFQQSQALGFPQTAPTNFPLNGFLVQATEITTSGTPTFSAADVNPTMMSLDLTNCGTVANTVDVTVDYQNIGSEILYAGTEVSFYIGDPYTTAATLITTLTTDTDVPPTGSHSQTFTIPNPCEAGDLYIVMNDNGTVTPPYTQPGTNVGECDYDNNSLFEPINCGLLDPSFTFTNYCFSNGGAPIITGDAGGVFSFNVAPGDGATIDPSTGVISNPTSNTYDILYEVGFCPNSSVVSVTVNDDCDGDGVTDTQEGLDGTNANDPCSFVLANQTVVPSTAWLSADCDGDGVTNGQEVTDGTDPLNACDLTLTNVSQNATSMGDCDGDGVTDADEINGTDGDFSTAGDNTDPNDPCDFNAADVTVAVTSTGDCDGDGVTDAQEAIDGTSSTDPCDLVLANVSQNATSTGDCDGDGVTDADEINGTDGDFSTTGDNTDPTNPCDLNISDVSQNATSTGDCDGDGVTDADEINGTDGDFSTTGDNTDPNNPCDFNAADVTVAVTSTGDCDGDGVTDAQEAIDGTSSTDPCDLVLANVSQNATSTGDCDGDGVTDADEINGTDGDFSTTGDNTDPNDPCDFNAADVSVVVTSTGDCDGDGVTDAQEAIDGTSSTDPCDLVLANVSQNATSTGDCDGDGVTDADEINGTDGDFSTAGDNTDPNDPCDFNTVDQTVLTSAAWDALDCDGDGISNGTEAMNGNDPNDPCDPAQAPGYAGYDPANLVWQAGDCDGDGDSNGAEDLAGSDPYCDQSTIAVPGGTCCDVLDPLEDCDGDGVTNGQEMTDGTNPSDPCDLVLASVSQNATSIGDCDGDGVTDADEINGTDGDFSTTGDNTDPNDPCDFNAADISLAVSASWNALDCDGDGVTNGQEVTDGTSATDPCDLILANVSQNATSTEDCDGDGVTDADEINGSDGDFSTTGDNTDPNDPCDFNEVDQTVASSAAWNALDCDGDGVTNGQEVIDGTSTTDPCDLVLANVSQNATSTGDCDGDGVTDADEINGTDGDFSTTGDNTDPTDPCDFNSSDQTVATSVAWNILDCDGDGTMNGTDTDPNDPCVGGTAGNEDTANPIWQLADCDGDGVTNGQEITDGTDATDPCDYLTASQTVATSAAWGTLDCDGDGVINGQEETDGTDSNDPCDYILTNQTVATSAAWNALDCDGDGTANGTDTDPTDPCVGGTTGNEDTANPIWQAEDCDGDGVTNGQEITDGTNPSDPCDYLTASQTAMTSAAWGALDCDGDGVTNGQEETDGTDSNDPCDFVLSNQTVPTSSAWNALDCDGDGTNNDSDSDPGDPCLGGTAGGEDTSNTIWQAADCDGDGVTNGQEITDGTDATDPCDYQASSQTLPTSASWNDLDCDGDGTSNGSDSDPTDPCAGGTTGNEDTSNPVWQSADCDGDGVTNGQEITDGTDTDDPCDYLIESQSVPTSSAWNTADCDGDGVTNGQEVVDGTNPLDPCDGLEGSITLPVSSNCGLIFHEGFSPNNDDVNDTYVIEGIEAYPSASITIFNRWGNKVYFSENGYANDWDGTNQFGIAAGSRELPVGTYFYILDLGDGSEIIRGYIYLNK